MTDFFKNPFQKKFIPVLVGIALTAALGGLTQEASTIVPFIGLDILAILTADKPLKRWVWYLFMLWGVFFAADAAMMVFVHAWLPFGVAAGLAAFVFSVPATRKVDET